MLSVVRVFARASVKVMGRRRLGAIRWWPYFTGLTICCGRDPAFLSGPSGSGMAGATRLGTGIIIGGSGCLIRRAPSNCGGMMTSTIWWSCSPTIIVRVPKGSEARFFCTLRGPVMRRPKGAWRWSVGIFSACWRLPAERRGSGLADAHMRVSGSRGFFTMAEGHRALALDRYVARSGGISASRRPRFSYFRGRLSLCSMYQQRTTTGWRTIILSSFSSVPMMSKMRQSLPRI